MRRTFINGPTARVVGFYPTGQPEYDIYKHGDNLHRHDGPAARHWIIGERDPYEEQYWQHGVFIR